ncbi:unnamed protein product [Chironomus riparius]|uniref:Secreted protein n=1 Tax=Chironomus riparius TaxID=315576 RepID=A0A9N9WNT0_9DIPT|nr:unnamed protein product [Chironomus riparius]
MFKLLSLGIFLIISNVQIVHLGSPTYKPTVTNPPKSSTKLPSLISLDKILPKTDLQEKKLIKEVEDKLELDVLRKAGKKSKTTKSYNKQNKKGLTGELGSNLNVALGQPGELLPI